MIFYDAKNPDLFYVHSSLAIKENGYKRIEQSDLEKIKKINENVATLATNSSGIGIKFETNSKKISLRVKLNGKSNMTHMSAVGQCGMDLYVYDDNYQKYVFHNTTKFDPSLSQYEIIIGNFETNAQRKIWIFLPLYMGVISLEIGIEKNSETKPLSFNNNKKIIFYGTSITQGACASRAGMSYTNILTRWLDQEIYNFGFSGSAFLEKEVAAIIAKVNNPSILFIDAQPNAGIDERLEKNLDNFIKEFRKYHPNIIVMVASRIDFAVDLYNSEKRNLNNYYQKWIKEYVLNKRKEGINIHFIDGKKIFKEDFTEMTVDGIHPTDLGFMSISKYYFQAIKAQNY